MAGYSNGRESRFNTGGDERTRIPPQARAKREWTHEQVARMAEQIAEHERSQGQHGEKIVAKKKVPARGKGEVRSRVTSGGARGAMDSMLKMHAMDPEALPMQRSPKAKKKARR